MVRCGVLLCAVLASWDWGMPSPFPCPHPPPLPLCRVVQGQAHAYTLALLATEFTTPFVNARFWLDKAGCKAHPVYAANGVAMLLRCVRALGLCISSPLHPPPHRCPPLLPCASPS